MLTLPEIEAARARIAPHLRQTPVMTLDLAGLPPVTAKLELHQRTGSFKARGAMNRLLSLPKGAAARGIVAASGGNHGLAVAFAAQAAGQRARIYASDGIAPEKAARIEALGASLTRSGPTFAEADAAARADVARTGASYFHPFADAAVMAGQGTLALEFLEQADFDTILIAVGGGGLIAGMTVALRALRPDLRIIGVEPEGAPTLHASRAAGRIVDVAITTAVPTLAAPRTSDSVWEIVRGGLDEVWLVSDDDMRSASRRLWSEIAIGADLAGAATTAALLRNADRLGPLGRIATVVCGAGSDGMGGAP